MIFLVTEDLHTNIRAERLQQVIDEDPSVLTEAEAAAIAIVKDSLGSRYDIDAIFSSVGDARPAQVVRWLKHIVLYDIAGRLPDKSVGARVIKNYEDTLSTLTDIEDGKKATLLPTKDVADVPVAKFRHGSDVRRNYAF